MVYLFFYLAIVTITYGKSCSCDSSDEFIRVTESLCFAPVIDGQFSLPVGWAFPSIDNSNSTIVRDLNGDPYFIFDQEANEGKGGYITKNKLPIGGVLILDNGLQILVDTGMGEVDPFINIAGTSPTNLKTHLELLGCTDIDVVILTHLHFDHVGWTVKYNNNNGIIPTWGHPTVYYVQNDEYYYWQKLQINNLEESDRNDPAYTASKEALLTHIDKLVDSGQIALRFGDYYITSNIEVTRCIGHTPGHQCVYIYDNNKNLRVMISGDAMHSPYQVAVPVIGPVFDVLKDEAIKTRKRLISTAFNGDNILFKPIHFPGVGHIVECDTCNSETGYVFKEITKEEVNQWSSTVMNQNDAKTDL